MGVNETAAAYLISDECAEECQYTDIGSLPRDWHVWRLNELATIRTGIAKNGGANVDNPILVHYLRVANVQDGYLDLSEMNQLKIRAEDLKRYAVLPGDMLMNEGGDLDKLGRGALWKGEFEPCVHQNHVFVVRCGPRLVPAFLSAWTGSAVARRFFMLAGRQTTNLASINKTSLGQFPIPLPPSKGEQQSIAEAVSDANALIESLSLLLEKKRQFKQAVMQELLAGRKRLPGFNRAWSGKRLFQLGEFLKGCGITRDQAKSGDLPCVRYGEIYTFHGDVIQRYESWISRAVASTATRLRSGDILFAGSGETKEEIGKNTAFVSAEEAYAGGDIIILRMRNTSAEFLSYLLNTPPIQAQKASRGQGDAVVHISCAALASIEVFIPDQDEQAAIALVISGMDEGIAVLQAKLDKAMKIKQGMVQSLLTGRIRLAQPASNIMPVFAKAVTNGTASIHPAHNWQINAAVVVGVLAQRFGTEQIPLPQKRRVKLAYLLHRYIEGKTEGLVKAVSFYYPNTKYEGSETIALDKGYVRTLRNEKCEGFVAGDNIEEAQHYFDQWYGTAALEWLERFRFRTTDDLELLATVDMAMVELATAGEPVDVDGVKHLIVAHPAWVPKLSRELFSDERIAGAIAEGASLFPA